MGELTQAKLPLFVSCSTGMWETTEVENIPKQYQALSTQKGNKRLERHKLIETRNNGWITLYSMLNEKILVANVYCGNVLLQLVLSALGVTVFVFSTPDSGPFLI